MFDIFVGENKNVKKNQLKKTLYDIKNYSQ